jgi:hypothetical protein
LFKNFPAAEAHMRCLKRWLEENKKKPGNKQKIED